MKENVLTIKSRDFAIRIIKCYKHLCDEKHEYIISKQLLRCGTSIGANSIESRHAQSRSDFISKLSIALKEADETRYWLDILHATNYLNDDSFKSMDCDCNELISILTSIIKRLKQPNK